MRRALRRLVARVILSIPERLVNRTWSRWPSWAARIWVRDELMTRHHCHFVVDEQGYSTATGLFIRGHCIAEGHK